MAEKGKVAVKKWVFGGKKRVIGRKKEWAGNQTRKVKWCKTQVLPLKTDKTKDV